MVLVEAVSLFGVKLDNPVTPWVMLALVSAGWLVVYLYVSAGGRA